MSKQLKPVKLLPAVERYTGIFFMVFKKWQREHPEASKPDLVIISAEFGLLRSDTPIPYYDKRMDATRAAMLAPRVRGALETQLLKHHYRRILVNLGRDYLRVLDGFGGLSLATWASGPIGVRARQLKAWLNEEAN